MEPYSMPELDKLSPAYEGEDTSSQRQTPGNGKKQYVGSEALPLLTSSAWSSVVHHPAEEDSEPDDLPSTVDMDAIKESPTTPLAPTTSKVSLSQCCDKNKRRGGEESESDGSDDDSDSSDDSDSASDSGSSGSCTWSESDSGSTSCSSRVSGSSRSSRVHQTFSIRETNIDQGGLKLKISALKIPKKPASKECTKPAESEPKVEKPGRDKVESPKPQKKPAATEAKSKAAVVQPVIQVPSTSSKVPKAGHAKVGKAKQAAKSVPKETVNAKVGKVVGKALAKTKIPVVEKVTRGGGQSKAATRSETRRIVSGKHKNKVSGANGGRGGIYNMRMTGGQVTAQGCPGGQRVTKADTPQQSSSDTEEEEGGEISQIAQQLVTAGEESIAISEHLQVINQEDLAAILPDVITPGHQDDEVCTPFDGFEDVSSESGKAVNRGTESSSDVELPEQVVSAAIERINLDGGPDSSSNGGASCDEEGHPYSSSLLQQFVEKTKLLSSQASEKTSEAPKRRKRGRPPKVSKSKQRAVPEMEAYMQLDLSVSNVSPDSGIQSVAGSPTRRSVSPTPWPINVANSPHSSPGHYTSEERGQKLRRGPGRPRGSGAKKDFASGTDSCDDIPPAPSLAVKRGPGRPKKAPVEDLAKKPQDIISSIEKIIKTEIKPQSKKKNNAGDLKQREALVSSKHPKSNAILNEICERVSKRLDLTVTSFPLKLSKVRLKEDVLQGGKLKRGRRKREFGDGGSEKDSKDKRRRRFSSSSPGSSSQRGNLPNHAAKPTAPRLLSLPRGVTHKHKKRKKKARQTKPVRVPEDPALLTDLERLVHMFRRSCTIALSKSSNARSEGSLPSIFRVKRIGKKRKGNEKSRNSQLASMSDKESGGEGDGKEKEKSRQRRPKKSAVEPPKGHHERTEPANNEQRLPLKKRHYHMSLPQDTGGQSTEKSSCDKTSVGKISPGEGTRKSISNDRLTEKTSEKASTKPDKASSVSSKTNHSEVKVKPISETHRTSRNSLTLDKTTDKPTVKPDKHVSVNKLKEIECKPKPTVEVPRKVTESSRKSINAEREKVVEKVPVKVEKGMASAKVETKAAKTVAEMPRNSIDEAIEACINRYSSPTVITTPKKRHRLEANLTVSPKNLPTTVAKSKDADVSLNNNNVKATGAVVQPTKRSTSRSASTTIVPTVTETKPIEGIFEPSTKIMTLDTPPSLPNSLARTVLTSKPVSPNNKVNIINIMPDVSPSLVSQNPSKNTLPSNKSSPALDKALTKPLSLMIESVENSVTSQNSNIISPKSKLPSNKSKVTPPKPTPPSKVTSPNVLAEITADVTPYHNLRLKRTNGALADEPTTPALKVVGKKKKLVPVPDVRIQVTKISPAEMSTDNSLVKKKVRRRKAINRTGFPVKKKKKKKVLASSEPYEDCETLIPKSIISVINEPTTCDIVQPIKTEKIVSQLDETISRVIENKLDFNYDSDNSRTGMEIDPSVLEPEVLLCERPRKRKRETDLLLNDTKQFPLVLKRFRRCKETADDTDSDIVVPEDVPSCDESTKSSGIRKKQPRWRKKFLVAGLFSDYFKEEEPRRVPDVGKQRLTYKPEEHKYGLLPPPYHCGRYIRQRKVEFKLPYDMWWQHLHSQLPGRDLVPSWNYKKIRTNVYYDVKPTYGYEAQACNCALANIQAQKGCADECINRMVYTECSSQLCPCKEFCSNQKIQRHEWSPGLDKFMTKDKGWGVKTKLLIKSGDFILEYVGEVVSEKEFKDRMASRYILDTHHYCLNLDGGLVIDGHRMGGDGRFVNHSCEPNCEMQKWSVNGLFRMALFALRDISPDEELSYDYNFSLFNPAEGQPCKCGSNHCRGVIGGKSQRLNGMPALEKGERRVVGRPRKNARKNSANIRQRSKKRIGSDVSNKTPVKPMSHQQRCFAQIHHCFLLRNLEKVKRSRDRVKEVCRRDQTVNNTTNSFSRPLVKHSDVFLTQLNALSCPRNMRTRRLAQAEDNPELTKVARLAYVFRDLYNIVATAKDECGEMLAAPFITLPTKRKLPAYYQRIAEPIDLTTLEQNIVTGFYRTVETFDADMIRLFTNNVRFYGRTSELGIVATRLRKVYNLAKIDFIVQLEEILGESPPSSFIPEHDLGGEEEDVIRCICGLYKDEGTMIQCERCLVWQHCDCVRADQGVEHYLCERCDRRTVDLEIKLEETPSYATPGLEYYVTLLRDNLQLRQGDTVYVLRDMDEEGTPESQPPVKVTYKTVKEVRYTDLDIFRVERLWKDEKGDRFAFGHHFLRPHETYHEPSRKFFPNEVMRVPLYEVVSVELIMGQCWVLDVNTYCKGRPVNAPEKHIYVCEYRVDKTAHLFTKIARPRYPICTKSYAFDFFDTKVKPIRTYTPHGRVPPRARGSRGPTCPAVPDIETVIPEIPIPEEEEEQIPLARRTSQKLRLNTILLHLLSRLPSKQPLDVSYLLEPGRRHRKKTSLLNT